MLSCERKQAIVALKKRIADTELNRADQGNGLPYDTVYNPCAPEYIMDEEETEAYRRTVRMLAYKDRCSSEIRKKLLSEGYSDRAAETAIERALRGNLINDERYAEHYSYAYLRAGKGVSGLERDLSDKGYSQEAIAQLLQDTLESTNELDRAVSFAQRHPTRSKNKLQGTYRNLVTHGFSSDVARRAARAVVYQG